MKKITFITLLLICTVSVAQSKKLSNIYPYYTENYYTPPYYRTMPTTYTDVNTVMENFRPLLSQLLRVNEKDVKYNLNRQGTKGTITYIFTSGVGKRLKYIYFKYNVFEYQDFHIVKDLTVTGDFDLVTPFYLRAWKTSLQKGDLKKSEWAYNYFYLDKISYRYKNGAIVKVTNNQFKTVQEFDAYREKSKAEYFVKKKKDSIEHINKLKRSDSLQKDLEKRKHLQHKRNIEKREQLRNKRNAQKPKMGIITAIKKRKNITFQKEPSERVKEFVNNYLKDKKKGTYIIYIKNINAKNLEVQRVSKY